MNVHMNKKYYIIPAISVETRVKIECRICEGSPTQPTTDTNIEYEDGNDGPEFGGNTTKERRDNLEYGNIW